MPEVPLFERLAGVREVIADRQALAGWLEPPQIIAVTKTRPAEMVRAAVEVGLRAVGENRVAEALDKQGESTGIDVEWHLIGSLQRRKVRSIVGRFDLIHSVDRTELALEIARRAEGVSQAVLVQVNCSGESQKSGVPPAELPRLLDSLRGVTGLNVRGLMTMAAFDADEAELHRTFGDLRRLRDGAINEGHELAELSMGMSNDYPIAVEEGATMLRLGTVLFGPRG